MTKKQQLPIWKNSSGKTCKMTPKVLFFDIDGTLLDYTGKMPASAKEALRQARLAGHRLVICSGRSGHQLSDWMFTDFDGIINCTGARVIYQQNVIYEHFVPREDVRRAREVLEAANGVLVAQTEECTILSQESYSFMKDYLVKMGRSQKRIERLLGNAVISPQMEAYDNIKKFFYHRSDKTVEQLEKELGDIFTVEASSFLKDACDSGEITCKGINKSYGMQLFILRQCFSKEDTIAFGDGPNDLDMLSFAGIGVAMGNARDTVKANADFITRDVGQDGIAYALKELGILKDF